MEIKCGCGNNMTLATSYSQNNNLINTFACEKCGRIDKLTVNVMDSKMMAMAKLLTDRHHSGGLVAKMISDMLNVMTFRSEGFVDAMSQIPLHKQVEFTEICFLWLMQLSEQKKSGWYDGRNEFSVDLGDKLWKSMKDEIPPMMIESITFKEISNSSYFKEDVVKNKELKFEVGFVIYFANEHRTLQQTFSGLVFDWLRNMTPEAGSYLSLAKEKCMEIEKEIPFFWKTPLI